jgi:hypothetical protein
MEAMASFVTGAPAVSQQKREARPDRRLRVWGCVLVMFAAARNYHFRQHVLQLS